MHGLSISELFTLALDVLVCTVVLRILLAWLFNYPRLVRLILILASLSAFAGLIDYFDLPLAGAFVPYIIIPVILVTLLNYLPDLTRIYKAASQGVILNPRIPASTRLIPELARTLHEMADRHMGSILAVGGKEAMESLVSGGESVSARINPSLLLSIFDTNCPRHDGAALIVGDQIVKIGAVLPLASAELTDPELGTRHLAALGLTQQCDAHVFVVSEERGSISHVHNSQIQMLNVESPETLESELLQILKHSPKESAGKPATRRWGSLLWLLAFTASLVASSSLTLFRQHSRQAPIPSLVSIEGKIKLIHMPEGLTAESVEPSTTTIWLNLPDEAETPLPAYDIAVDLTGWTEGKEDVALTPAMVENLDAGMTISSFEPDTIEIRLTEKPESSGE